MHQPIPNSFQEDVNFVQPQKALAMGKSNMDYKSVDKSIHKPGNPHKHKASKGGY